MNFLPGYVPHLGTKVLGSLTTGHRSPSAPMSVRSGSIEQSFREGVSFYFLALGKVLLHDSAHNLSGYKYIIYTRGIVV